MFILLLLVLLSVRMVAIPYEGRGARSSPREHFILTRTQSITALPLAYIETSRDGVAMIPLSDLLGVVPELRGKPSDGMHLVRKGRAIPIALVDGDGMLSDDDTLFFVGSRPAGDTTYFDAYTSYAAFEVWYDPLTAPVRLHREGASPQGLNLRKHLRIERHLEEEHEYVQGWLDNDRYRQTQTTFVTETVPGEGWRWSLVYSTRPFSTLLFVAPDPSQDDSLSVELHYSSISDDIYTNPDNRLQLLYAAALRDSATYDGVRDNVLSFTLRPARDGCIVDSLVLRNTAPTIAAQAVDFIRTRGTEYAAAWNDKLVGECYSAEPEAAVLVNFRSPDVVFCDTIAGTWGIYHGERGLLFRVAARTFPERLGIALGDTVFVTSRYPLAVVWFDENQKVQLFTENSASAIAGLINALPYGTPYAVAIADGRYSNDQLRTQLAAEGSIGAAQLQPGMAFVAISIRGQLNAWRERINRQAAALIEWLPSERSQSVRVTIPLEGGKHGLVATGIASVERARVRRCGGADLIADTAGAEYLVITHAAFRSAAERLAQYRARRNNLRARVVDVQDIFDVYGHGEKSPHAIKSFLRSAVQRWREHAPRAVLLIGDASWDPRKVSRGATNDDYIPSYGKPVSDFWYTLLDSASSLQPALSIGRLPVRSAAEAEAVVDKIIEYDTLPWQSWQKHFLLIAGGADQDEQFDFYQSIVYSLLPLLVDEHQRALCAETTVVSSYTGSGTGATLPAAIVNRINNGTVWVNYIGHGAPRSLEIGGWEPERLSNRSRYPILASFSCQIGAFAEPSIQALGEEFLTARNAGMIAVIATTGFGIRSYDDIVNSGLLATLARTPVRTLGDVLNAAKQYLNDGSQLAINTAMQTTLLGDPLTRIPIDTVAHPVLDPASLSLTSVPHAPILSAQADSVRAEATLFNAGIHSDTTIELRVIHRYKESVDSSILKFDQFCYPERFTVTVPIHQKPGAHVLQFIGKTNQPAGSTFDTLTIPFYVYAEQLLAVEPLPGWNISPRDTIVRFLNPFATTGRYEYQAMLLSSSGDTLASSQQQPVEQHELLCVWRLPYQIQPWREYTVLLRAHNIAGDTWTPWLRIPVTVVDTVRANEVVHLQGIESWSESKWNGFDPQPDGSLSLSSTIALELLSAGGYQESRNDTIRVMVQPAYRLRVGGVNVASERGEETGVHLAVLSARDGTVRAVRWFATWTTTPVPRSDGGPQELIAFLHDSINVDEYLVLVSCGPAWGLQYSQYASAVSNALALYGADSAASLSGSRSYLLIGMRSAKRPYIVERVGDPVRWQGGDTLRLSVALPLFPEQATLELPPVGPADLWDDVTIDCQCQHADVQLEIYGGLSADRTSTLILVADSTERSLANVDATQFPFLRIAVRIRRTEIEDFTSCIIRHAAIRYCPLPEFAVRLEGNDDAPLRGDTLLLQARVVNLVTRSSERTATVRWNLVDDSGTHITSETLPDIPIQLRISDTTIVSRIATDMLPDKCVAKMTVELPPDLYVFNNVAILPFQVRSDLVPPTILAMVNGDQISDTTFVPRAVTLDILLLDSARVPITDSTVFVIRLNGALLQTMSTSYEFFGTTAALRRWAEYALVRAAVSANTMLERGVNVLHITAQDATGNRTTMQRVLIVPDDLRLDSTLVVPNPIGESEVAHVHVRYRGFDPLVPAWLELYDARGSRVRSDRVVLRSGQNIIELPLRDESSGGRMQSGAYFWRLWIEALGSNSAVGGMVVVVR